MVIVLWLGKLATLVVGLLGLGISAWLAPLLISLAPRRWTSWHAAILLWLLSAIFALALLQVAPPVAPVPRWLPFDLMRWLLIPIPLLWVALLPGLVPERGRAPLTRLWRVAALLTWPLLLLTLLVTPTPLYAGLRRGQWGDLFYPAFLAVILSTLGPALVLSWRAAALTRVPASRRAARTAALAGGLAILAALYGIGLFWLGRGAGGGLGLTTTADRLALLMLPGLALLLLAVITLGGAAVLRRVGQGEANLPYFFYHLANAAAISFIYILVAVVVGLLLQVPWTFLILLLPLAVLIEWLGEAARGTFDRLFYRAPVQDLRGELRALLHDLDLDGPLAPQLTPALARLAGRVNAAALAVAAAHPEAGDDERLLGVSFPVATRVEAERYRAMALDGPAQSVPAPPGALPAGPPMLIPLAAPAGRLGLLIAWPQPGRVFDDVALALLETAGGQLTALVAAWQAHDRQLQQIETLAEEARLRARALRSHVQRVGSERTRPSLESLQTEARGWVEEALRSLSSVGTLGAHPLATLAIVEQRLAPADGAVTHLDRGQAVRRLLEGLVQQLRPAGDPPPEPYPAAWRHYTILHGAYLQDIPNRELMSRLYISQSTFHRARREALDAIATALVELERAERNDGVME